MPGSVANNALANVIQIFISTLLIFVLYRYIGAELGVDQLGVWSVVLATASASRLADLGLSAGITRFVARDLARALPRKAAQTIETSVITLAIMVVILLIGLYPVLRRVLAFVFSGTYLEQANDILPFALVSLWMAIVASVAQSGLDGCQRMVPRAALIVLGQLVMVALAFALVPRLGLLGLAWAQIGQSAFLLVVGWVVLRSNLPEVPLLPTTWSRSSFREMLAYGANVQVANLSMLLLDPMTKVLMVKFGGPTAAGYFEIASQVVLRMRTLIVAANQAIVPKIAHLGEVEPAKLLTMYRQNISLLTMIALPMYALLFAWSLLLSRLIIGHDESQFTFFLQVGVIAWMANTFSAPAYFVNMGIGSVRINTIAHLLMGVLNFLFGCVLGYMYGAVGVAWSHAVSLMLGSMWLITAFHVRNSIHLHDLWLREHVPLLGVCVAVSLVGGMNVMEPIGGQDGWVYYLVMIFVFPFVLGVALMLHPRRHVLWSLAVTPFLRLLGLGR